MAIDYRKILNLRIEREGVSWPETDLDPNYFAKVIAEAMTPSIYDSGPLCLNPETRFSVYVKGLADVPHVAHFATRPEAAKWIRDFRARLDHEIDERRGYYEGLL